MAVVSDFYLYKNIGNYSAITAGTISAVKTAEQGQIFKSM